MSEYNEEQIQAVARALLNGLKSQGVHVQDGAPMTLPDPFELIVDGRVNLWLLAQDAIDAWESTPHEPRSGT